MTAKEIIGMAMVWAPFFIVMVYGLARLVRLQGWGKTGKELAIAFGVVAWIAAGAYVAFQP